MCRKPFEQRQMCTYHSTCLIAIGMADLLNGINFVFGAAEDAKDPQCPDEVSGQCHTHP